MGRKRKVVSLAPAGADVGVSNGVANKPVASPVVANANLVPHSQHNASHQPTTTLPCTSFTCTSNGVNQQSASQPQGSHLEAGPSSTTITKIGQAQIPSSSCPPEVQLSKKRACLNPNVLFEPAVHQHFMRMSQQHSQNPNACLGLPMEQQKAEQLNINSTYQLSHKDPLYILQPKPFAVGTCVRRLMTYLLDQKQLSAKNDIHHWKQFVEIYYAATARKKWCLSLYPPKAQNPWKCSLCGSESRKGVEVCFDALAGVYHAKFNHGIIEERITLHSPNEVLLPSGFIVLDDQNATIMTIDDKFQVIHEGRLRIVFTHDLKIKSWDFCAERHKELLSSKLAAQKLNELICLSQLGMSKIQGSGSDGLVEQHLQDLNKMRRDVGMDLVKGLQPRALNEWDYLDSYAQQMELVNSATELMDTVGLCLETNRSPIDIFKNYSRSSSTVTQMNGSNGAHEYTGCFPRPTSNPMASLPQPVAHQMLGMSTYNKNERLTPRQPSLVQQHQEKDTTSTYATILGGENECNGGGKNGTKVGSADGLHLSEELIAYLCNNDIEIKNGNGMDQLK